MISIFTCRAFWWSILEILLPSDVLELWNFRKLQKALLPRGVHGWRYPFQVWTFLPSSLCTFPRYLRHCTMEIGKPEKTISNILLADGFTRKNLRRHNGIYSVYYYWHGSGSYNYWWDYYPPIWRYTFIVRKADWRAITEFYTHREIYLHWMIV